MREGESGDERLRVKHEKSKAFALVGSLSGDGIATVTGKQGDSRPPSVNFTKETKSCLAEPYKEAIVIKVLDKHYGYTALMHKLQIVWRIKGGFDLLDVGFGYFLVNFDIAADREKVILGGPWLIDEIPVKVYLATKLAESGKYARVCVQINLELPVIKHIIVEGVTYEVEYESLQLICATCTRYGHDKSLCMEKESLEGNENSFGNGKNNEAPTLVPHNNHEIQKEAESEARDLG
nr:uncharacterized protein LOC112701037 [Arachis hypogaea]